MPRTDDGFQGARPGAFGDVWDKMTSPERRSAFRWDLIIGIGGTALVYAIMRWLTNWQ